MVTFYFGKLSISTEPNFIEKAISETELKHDLLKEINELKTIDNPDDYMLKYQNFVAILANHVTAFLPVLNFLLTQVPK